MAKTNGKFKRSMRPLDVWALALGAIIGWGCFVLPGNAFLPKAGPLGTALGMLIGASLILVIAGLSLFGFMGMILLPLFCTCIYKTISDTKKTA